MRCTNLLAGSNSNVKAIVNGFKLKEYVFILDIRKTLFRMRVVKHSYRVSREAVAPSMEAFNASLVWVLSNLIN